MVLSILLLAALVLLFGFSAYGFYKRSKHVKMAKWARKNKGNARFLLVLFNVSMALIGVSLGMLCSKLDLHLSVYTIYVGLGLFVFGTVFFPSSEKGSADLYGRYRRKQILALCRVAGSSLAMIAFANEFIGGHSADLVTTAAVSPVVLIILATLGLVIFGVMILAFSCGLACNGYEGAAMLLLFGGGFVLIVGYILLLLRIIRKGKERKVAQGRRPSSADALDEL